MDIKEFIETRITSPGGLTPKTLLVETDIENAWQHSGKLHITDKWINKTFSVKFCILSFTGWYDEREDEETPPDEFPILTIKDREFQLTWDNYDIFPLLRKCFPNAEIGRGKTIILKQ